MSNTTLDDGDPSLTYSGSGWQTNAQQNVSAPLYYNKTFHTTCHDQDYMEYSFTDTVYVYGAARTNKGYYSISLDGGAKTYYNGYSPQDVNQYLLWGMRSDGEQHQVRVYNEPTYQAIAGRDCLGIDDVILEAASTTTSASAPTSSLAATLGTSTASDSQSASTDQTTSSAAMAASVSTTGPADTGMTVTLAADSSGPHTSAVTGGDVVTVGQAGRAISPTAMSLVLIAIPFCLLFRRLLW